MYIYIFCCCWTPRLLCSWQTHSSFILIIVAWFLFVYMGNVLFYSIMTQLQNRLPTKTSKYYLLLLLVVVVVVVVVVIVVLIFIIINTHSFDSLSRSIPIGKSSRLYPISTLCWWMFLLVKQHWCGGVLRRTSLMCLFLLAQYVLFVLLGWFVWWEVSGRTTAVLWGAASRIFLKTAHSILV